MKVLFEEFYDWVPKWRGNDRDSSPVIFHCRYLSASEWGRYLQKEIVTEGEKARIVMNYKDRDIFESSVISIEGLEVNGKQVKTARDFLAYPMMELYQEAVIEFITRNNRPDLKN